MDIAEPIVEIEEDVPSRPLASRLPDGFEARSVSFLERSMKALESGATFGASGPIPVAPLESLVFKDRLEAKRSVGASQTAMPPRSGS
jgi:hypothetical protein